MSVLNTLISKMYRFVVMVG